jgi:hypothetical protein
MITLNKLISTFETFATNHTMINDFGCGSYYKIDTKQARKYPLMWITPTPSNWSTSENRFNFDIMFADILDPSETNQNEVWSDMEQLCQDFVRYLSTTYGVTSGELYDVRLDDAYYKEPFSHLLDNETAGYFLRITIITPANTSYCINPS